MLLEKQKQELLEVFKGVDNLRLSYGPDDPRASYLHGVMLGMREALEHKRLEVEGITGLWWYETDFDGNKHRQLSAAQLVRKYGRTKEISSVVDGNALGVSWVLDVLEDTVKPHTKEQFEEFKKNNPTKLFLENLKL